MSEIHDILKHYWGYDSFRPLQEDIIRSVMRGEDTLGLMPTGGGKSLTFQVPALVMEGTCIVVTPLISLMKDQVEHLHSKRIKAAAIHSGMTFREINTTLDNALFGGYKLLYVSPERLATEAFLNRLKKMQVSILVVDESHCISQWGYDFRPSYLHIADIREHIPDTPVLALTATATPDVVKDIQDKLLFRKYNVMQKSFYRENLVYVVRTTENKLGALQRILDRVPGSSVVYVRSRKRSKEIAEQLNQVGIKAEYYNAGLSNTEREERQTRWMNDGARVMVATNAFGMGIDKPDVRTVVHIDMPDNLESYFQEAGRAGRDGQKAYAILLYSNTDQATLHRRITDTFPQKDFVRKVYDKLCYYYQVANESGAGRMFVFSLETFCAQYKMPVLHVHSALQLLQQAGYLELSEDVESKGKVKFAVDRTELYNQDTTKQQDEIISTLLRSYTGMFIDFAEIDEDIIAHRCGLTRRTVVDELVALAHAHVIQYVPRRRANYITYLCNRIPSERLRLDSQVYEQPRKRYEQRISDMIEYATQNKFCRSQVLLLYFGQSESHRCGQCDVCLSRTREETESEALEQIAYQILAMLRQQPMTISRIVASINAPSEQVARTVSILADQRLIVLDDKMHYNLQQHKK